jgi:hypothetical protein
MIVKPRTATTSIDFVKANLFDGQARAFVTDTKIRAPIANVGGVEFGDSFLIESDHALVCNDDVIAGIMFHGVIKSLIATWPRLGGRFGNMEGM